MLKSNFGKTGTLASIVFAVIILCGVLIFLLILGTNTKKESEVIVSNEVIEIKGMYGNTYKTADVSSIELKDTIPGVGRKTNGAGLGEIKKGYFEVSGIGECLLFIHSDKGPYLFINTNNEKIILNYNDAEKTMQVYNDLMSKWNH